MGARGPLPKPSDQRQRNVAPTGLIVLDGERDMALADVPPPPPGLAKASVAVWEAFWRSDVARAVDAGSDMGRLVRWIGQVDEYHRVRSQFRRQRTALGSQGQLVLHPLGTYMHQLESEIANTEKEFGMTPASRARLGLTVGMAKLTAAQLNEMLARQPGGADDIEGEYAEYDPA